MAIHVVAGSQKGRRLKHPTGGMARPTSSRVKEALFSIIANRLPHATVLDLFAGTGSLGLEALSRGADHVVFVENHLACLEVLRENIRNCSLTERCTLIPQSVERFLRVPVPQRHDRLFDVVFADPPYAMTDLCPLLWQLERCGIVAPQGVIILEHFKKTDLPLKVGRLDQTRQCRYGDTMLTFYHHEPAPDKNECA